MVDQSISVQQNIDLEGEGLPSVPSLHGSVEANARSTAVKNCLQ